MASGRKALLSLSLSLCRTEQLTRRLSEGTERKLAQAGEQRLKSARTCPRQLGRLPALTFSPFLLFLTHFSRGLSQLRPQPPSPQGGRQPASQTRTVCASTAPGPAPPPTTIGWRSPGVGTAPLYLRGAAYSSLERKGKSTSRREKGLGRGLCPVW